MSDRIKIALLGYGKMGRMIEQIADDQRYAIVAKINTHSNDVVDQISRADVCIDFTHPGAALTNIRHAAACGINMVMGTTGWYEELDQAKQIVVESGIGFVYAPNFSIGVALFQQLVSSAATLIGQFDNYDVSGLEIHHRGKADSPSGTALSLTETLLAAHPLKKNAVFERPERQLMPEEFHFASLRTGSVPGTHTITFDSADDSITLTHAARSRRGFAAGAVAAAEWLVGKKGFFCFDEMIFSKKSGKLI